VPSKRANRTAVRLVPSSPETIDGFESLPQPLTSFIGRDQTTDDVIQLLLREDVRLVTLTGPGGMGKTRLAIRVASETGKQFDDGVVFVGLAPLIDPELVLPTIAHSLGVLGTTGRPLVERLIQSLSNRRLLIVLDNFEQVSAAAGSLAALVAASSMASFLVTSRVPLRISGEQEFAVPPLEVPPAAFPGIDAVAENPSVALFVNRARSVLPAFQLDDSNAVPVVEICRFLEGLPLAIELAAARVKFLPPQRLFERLSKSLDILTGGPQDQPARLQAMRATIGWSYDLLSPVQQSVFRRLSMFAGGLSLEAAERVCDEALMGISPTGEAPLEILMALIDASLLIQEAGFDGEPRIAMLETIRQFGLEQLKGGPDEDVAREWLVKWCVDVADQARAAFSGRGPGTWGKRLLQEYDNQRAALTALAESGSHDGVLRLATSLAPLWLALGNEREGYRWLTEHLDRRGGRPDTITVGAELLAARLANALGDLDAASALVARGREHATAIEDSSGIADAHCILGNIARGLGQQDAAQTHYLEALERYRDLEDRYNMGYTLVQLAKLGDLGSVDRPGSPEDQARSQQYCAEAIALYRDLGNTWGTARATHQLAYVTYKRREYMAAARLSTDALRMVWEHGDLTEAAGCFEDLADIATALGHPLEAARLYGVAEGLRERLGVPMWPSYRDEYEREVAVARNALDADAFDRAWHAGRDASLSAAVDTALAFVESVQPASSRMATALELRPAKERFGLTERELEVVRLLAEGYSNQAIADALFISLTTAKGHVRNIMAKLNLDSRTAVAAWAHQQQIV
jgi:predicted ATPase/DNA-binding CsgD family transcriptional regulator